MFKTMKPADKPGIKVFNPATGRDLEKDGESVEMTNYWKRVERCGDAVEVKAEIKSSVKKNQTIENKKSEE